jgi:hypothetical protein
MPMREGDLVVVLGKLDQRIYQQTDSLTVGTLWILEGDLAVVILSNHLLWKGFRREIASWVEQSPQASEPQ